MSLLFRSTQGPWSVWTCECCGDPVKFVDAQELSWVGKPKVYIAHHAPLGTHMSLKGMRYEFDAQSAPVSVEASIAKDPTPSTPKAKTFNSGAARRVVGDMDFLDEVSADGEFDLSDVLREFERDEVTPIMLDPWWDLKKSIPSLFPDDTDDTDEEE